MKRLLFSALLFACSVPAVAAQTFTWEASPGAAGYRLFCGVNGGNPGAYNVAPLFDVATNAAQTVTMAPGQYRCAMKAYAPAGAACSTVTAASSNCSPYSNEVVAVVAAPPLPAPTNLKFLVTLACDDTTHLCTMQIAQIPVQ